MKELPFFGVGLIYYSHLSAYFPIGDQRAGHQLNSLTYETFFKLINLVIFEIDGIFTYLGPSK